MINGAEFPRTQVSLKADLERFYCSLFITLHAEVDEVLREVRIVGAILVTTGRIEIVLLVFVYGLVRIFT